MRQLLSFLLSLSFMMSSVAGAAPLCAEVHSSISSKSPMIDVQPMPVIGSSYLKVHPLRLKQDSEGLATLINLSAQTSGVKLDPKLLDKKNELVLGLLIPNSEFSLEMEYRADGRFGRKLVLQEISLISPTLSRKVVAKQVLKADAFELANEGVFELKEGFPAGFEVQSQIPVVIDQKLMDDFQKFYPNVENFNNAELRKMTQDRKMGTLNFMSHFRKLKEIAKEVFIKLPFKQFGNVLVTVLIVSKLMGPHGSQVEYQTVATPPPSTRAWVSNVNLNFAMTLGKSAQSEILSFNQELQEQLGRKSSGVAMDFSQPKIKVGETDFVWLIEKPDLHKTYVAFTHNKDLATVEMFFVEIDPVKYPKIVSTLKNQNMQVKVQ